MSHDAEDSARLAAHAAECAECRETALPLPQIAAALNAVKLDLDPGALSQRTLVRLRPELHRRARIAALRRVAAGVLLSLIPLPLVLVYDAVVLRGVYDVVSSWLPVSLASYLVISYAASLVLLFSLTYAAIPLLVIRGGPARSAAEYV